MLWLAWEIAGSATPLLQRRIHRLRRRLRVNTETIDHHHVSLATIGFVLVIPVLILCFGGILQSLGYPAFNKSVDYTSSLFSPVTILGGLFLGFLLNLLSVFRLKFEEGHLVGTLRLAGRLLNLSMIAFATLLVSIISVYLLAENLAIFALR